MGKLSGLLAICSVLASASAQADALADLRVTLAGLRGSDPIAASLGIEQTGKRGDREAPKVSTGKAELDARLDETGLQIAFSTATMARFDAEADARTANPEASTPLGDLLRESTPTRIAGVLSYAAPLLRKLEQATLKEDRVDTRDGRSLRLLVLDTPPNLSAKDKDSMKEFSGVLKIWLDEAGYPVAIDQRQTFSGRRMLISFNGGNTESVSLRRQGDRLLATRQERQQTFSGFGESSDTLTSITLKPL